MLDGTVNFFSGTSLTAHEIGEFIFRVVLSAVFGILIGLERSKHLKDAGVRTHFIIASASAVFMIISKYGFSDVGAIGMKIADPARVAAQVVSGVSVLCAGVIINHSLSIKGLTTAAGMWATSAVGLAVGAGLYILGLVETALLVFIQFVLHRFPVGNDMFTTQKISVVMLDTPYLRDEFFKLISRHHGEILNIDMSKEGEYISIEVILRLKEPVSSDSSITFLEEHEGVSHISV